MQHLIWLRNIVKQNKFFLTYRKISKIPQFLSHCTMILSCDNLHLSHDNIYLTQTLSQHTATLILTFKGLSLCIFSFPGFFDNVHYQTPFTRYRITFVSDLQGCGWIRYALLQQLGSALCVNTHTPERFLYRIHKNDSAWKIIPYRVNRASTSVQYQALINRLRGQCWKIFGPQLWSADRTEWSAKWVDWIGKECWPIRMPENTAWGATNQISEFAFRDAVFHMVIW